MGRSSRSSVVQDYNFPQPGSTSTLTLDQKTQNEIAQSPIPRPSGYDVSWHFNPEVERHHFGQTHPMKPWRLTLTKQLVIAYGMYEAMDLYLTRAATRQEVAEFHRDDYIDFLQTITPANMDSLPDLEGTFRTYNFGDDCPVFDGLWNYCTLYAGASVDAARKLCNDQSQIAINWSGGLHHAKKGEASGFCYINDIVLSILQLLRIHPRVLYIDIDVHHGDGVEQAFWSTDRVLTLSFHKYDGENFFPATGPLDSTGPTNPLNPGAHHALNVPLNDGIEDDSYIELFKAIVGPVIGTYHPSAIVLQCGADSLGCDRLGCFNLNIRAHGACAAFVKSFKLPMLVLGGGGYTPRNVARLWAHETSIMIEASDRISEQIPTHTPALALNAFQPEGPTLFPKLTGRHANHNTREYLHSLVEAIHEQLRYLKGAPSTQLQVIPPDLMGLREEVEDELAEGKEDREEERKRRERGVGTKGCVIGLA
ncbi:MAG: histone deacetylase [Cirrosporium novae-zelandiae]|nr:MAG: histone deacetylase [Cirrosporium novae-zelandiae]